MNTTIVSDVRFIDIKDGRDHPRPYISDTLVKFGDSEPKTYAELTDDEFETGVRNGSVTTDR